MFFEEKFIYRTPMLPASEFIKIDQIDIDKKLTDPLILEAIYLASPELYSQIQKLLKGKISDPKKVNQIYNSLYKYIARMHHRSTPFGLFAKVGVGMWSEKCEINIYKNFTARLQLDMNFLLGIYEKILENVYVRKQLYYRKNTTILKLFKKYRYVEYHYEKNRRIHDVVDIKRFKILDKLLSKADSPISYKKLIEFITEEGPTKEQSEQFLDSLIKSQLIISNIEPSTIGESGLKKLICDLRSINSENNRDLVEMIFLLENLLKSMTEYKNNTNSSFKIYNKFANKLSETFIKPQESSFLQIDSYDSKSKFYLNKNDQMKFLNLIKFLNKVTPNSEHYNLNRFKENFTKEYDGQYIPLLQALDTESGIGYKGKDINGLSEFVDDLKLPHKQKYVSGFSELQSVLLKILIKGIKEGKHAIQIIEKDFSNLNYQTESLPDTIPIIFKRLSNNKYYIQNIGGGSAANLIGRFAQENSEINEVLQKIIAFEQDANNEFVFAEINHLPEKRTGNILRRPKTFHYEIPYLASSSAEVTKKIYPEDLYVSIKNNRIMLWSKSLKKYIIPRLTTAHNFTSRSLPVYNFLCDLQYQQFQKSYLGLNWSMLSIDTDFFPRIEFGDFVLSRARWVIRKEDWDIEKISNDEGLMRWCQEKKLPKCFLIIENDNELYIDLSIEIAKRVFLKHLISNSITNIEEYISFEKDDNEMNSQVWGNEIFSIIYNSKTKKKELYNFDKIELASKRDFIIGDEWFYIKIYAGFKSVDNILIFHLPKLLNKFKKNEISDDFFFVRFTDPDLHLRIRFRVKSKIDNNKLIYHINDFIKSITKYEKISNFQIETYKREIERYGSKSIDICENIFCIDSKYTLSFLVENKVHFNSELNIILYILLCMDFIISFAFKKDEFLRDEFIIERLGSFEKETINSKDITIKMDQKYRKIKKDVNSIFSEYPPNEFNFIITHFQRKKKNLTKELNKLKEIYPSQPNDARYNVIIGSIIHMMVNRAFKSKQRLYEHLLYSFLTKQRRARQYLFKKNLDIK
ncbi:MAG: lantibiotic dehydratase [Bacteroidetes bacterium]|nr:lantibiotic dehydratase [Bacteroidota bacterium]